MALVQPPFLGDQSLIVYPRINSLLALLNLLGHVRVSYSGGFTPGMNLTWRGYPPHQLEFFGNLFSGFENLITLTNLKWNLRH
jgi:hypothetical protein